MAKRELKKGIEKGMAKRELAKFLNVTNARRLLNSLEIKELKAEFKNQFSEEVKRKL